MNLQTRISKLEQATGVRGGEACAHAFTIKIDGVVTHDPPPCGCGGFRRTLAVEYVRDWRADGSAGHEAARGR